MDEALQVGTMRACLPRRAFTSLLGASGGRPFVSVVSLHAPTAGEYVRAARCGTARDGRGGSEAQREDVSRAHAGSMQPCGPPTVFRCPSGRISAYRPHSHTRAARTPGAWRSRTHKTPGRPRHSKQRATERARVPYRPRLRCVRPGQLRVVRSWKHCVDLKASHEVPPTGSRPRRSCALGCAGEAWACVGRQKRA